MSLFSIEDEDKICDEVYRSALPVMRELYAEAFIAGQQAMRLLIIAKIREMAPVTPARMVDRYDDYGEVVFQVKEGPTIKLLKPETIVTAIAALPLESL